MICKICDKILEEEGFIGFIYYFIIICMFIFRKYFRIIFGLGGGIEFLYDSGMMIC